MNVFTILILIVAPSVLVTVTAWLLLNKLLQSFGTQRKTELQKSALQQVTPVRLRAYERLILLLERTNPETLILNNYKTGMTCFDLHVTLQSAIRQEFAHNVSQQIYVTDTLWQSITHTKESILNLINLCASKCPPNADGAILAEGIIKIFGSEQQNPTETAIAVLKNEVADFF
ncbi:MAG: hypothetical protein LBS01_10330 [Prevotellaceae bacterium]|jgi:hypothetical protein|nr:hypothetical protein [Prevotellaceae bacterium]